MKKISITKMTEQDQLLLNELEYQIWVLGSGIRETSLEINRLAGKQRGRKKLYHNLILLKNKLIKGELAK